MEDRTKQELEIVGSKFEAYKAAAGWIQFMSCIFRWFSAPLECFLRRDFGERYMTWLRLWLAWGIVSVFVWLPGLGNGTSGLYWMVFVAFIGMGFYHRFVIWKKNREGLVWHSQFMGEPWGLFQRIPVERSILNTHIEPIACVLIALCLFGVDRVVGLWLLISSIALLVHRQMDAMAIRNRMLDQLDAQIDAHYEEQMRKEQGDINFDDPLQTEGWIAPPKDLRQRLARQRQPVEKTVSEAMGPEIVPLQPA